MVILRTSPGPDMKIQHWVKRIRDQNSWFKAGHTRRQPLWEKRVDILGLDLVVPRRAVRRSSRISVVTLSQPKRACDKIQAVSEMWDDRLTVCLLLMSLTSINVCCRPLLGLRFHVAVTFIRSTSYSVAGRVSAALQETFFPKCCSISFCHFKVNQSSDWFSPCFWCSYTGFLQRYSFTREGASSQTYLL